MITQQELFLILLVAHGGILCIVINEDAQHPAGTSVDSVCF